LLILGRLWDAEDADGGAVANDRVLGSRVALGTSLCCRGARDGGVWEPEEKDLSLVVSLLVSLLYVTLRYSLLVASYQVWMECSQQGILYVHGAEDKCAILVDYLQRYFSEYRL